MWAIPLFFAYMLLMMLVSGGSIDIFWQWFIEPVFAGAPHLSLGTSLGVGLVCTVLTQSATVVSARSDGRSAGLSAVTGLLFWIVCWLVALLYHYVFGI